MELERKDVEINFKQALNAASQHQLSDEDIAFILDHAYDCMKKWHIDEYSNFALDIEDANGDYKSVMREHGMLYQFEDVRKFTNALLDAVIDGRIDENDALLACLKHMSEDDVKKMCEMNEFNIYNEEEDE